MLDTTRSRLLAAMLGAALPLVVISAWSAAATGRAALKERAIDTLERVV